MRTAECNGSVEVAPNCAASLWTLRRLARRGRLQAPRVQPHVSLVVSAFVPSALSLPRAEPPPAAGLSGGRSWRLPRRPQGPPVPWPDQVARAALTGKDGDLRALPISPCDRRAGSTRLE